MIAGSLPLPFSSTSLHFSTSSLPSFHSLYSTTLPTHFALLLSLIAHSTLLYYHCVLCFALLVSLTRLYSHSHTLLSHAALSLSHSPLSCGTILTRYSSLVRHDSHLHTTALVTDFPMSSIRYVTIILCCIYTGCI